jgi:hypothetical protein
MKTRAVIALAAMAIAPVLAPAQTPAPSLQRPSARDGLDEQISAIAARIDRRQSRGEISAEDADHARLEVNDLQARVADARSHDGGRLTEEDRFGLERQIHDLEDKIDRQRTGAPGPAPH